MPQSCSANSNDLADPEIFKLICHIMTFIEVPIHTYGAWCILFKTSDTMKPVKWLLLWSHCISALLDLWISVVSIPYILFPTFSGYALGLIDNAAIEVYLALVLIALVTASILSIYENRYFILFGAKNNSCWGLIRKPILVFNYILALVFAAPMYFFLPVQDVAFQKLIESLPCTPELYIGNRHIFIAAVDFQLGFICLSFGTITLAFQILTFFVLTLTKINKQRQANGMVSTRTHDLQKKFLIALGVQSSVPIILLLTPVTYILTSLPLIYYNQSITNFCILIIGSHGVLATLVMIFIHQPYRNATFEIFYWFCRCKKQRANKLSKPTCPKSSVNGVVKV